MAKMVSEYVEYGSIVKIKDKFDGERYRYLPFVSGENVYRFLRSIGLVEVDKAFERGQRRIKLEKGHKSKDKP